jgi:hypothetical protein
MRQNIVAVALIAEQGNLEMSFPADAPHPQELSEKVGLRRLPNARDLHVRERSRWND